MTKNWWHEIDVSEESVMRVEAYINANLDEVFANCKECGARIPVELTLCTICHCMKDLR